MIDLKRTMGDLEFERPVNSASEAFDEEGQMVLGVLNATTGVEEARRTDSTDAAGRLLGFAKTDDIAGASDSEVLSEEAVVPSTADGSGDYHVTLGFSVTAEIDANGDVSVYDKTNAAFLTLGAAIASGVFAVTDAANGELEFHSDEAGIEIDVIYRHEMTAREKRMKYQGRSVNNSAGGDLDRVGIISGVGEVYTDQYDVSVGNWASATPCLGANGVISGAGGADISAVVQVIKTPTVDDPFLGLRFNLPAVV